MGLLKNQLPPLKAYSEGLITVEGELIKPATLGMIVTALGGNFRVILEINKKVSVNYLLGTIF